MTEAERETLRDFLAEVRAQPMKLRGTSSPCPIRR